MLLENRWRIWNATITVGVWRAGGFGDRHNRHRSNRVLQTFGVVGGGAANLTYAYRYDNCTMMLTAYVFAFCKRTNVFQFSQVLEIIVLILFSVKCLPAWKILTYTLQSVRMFPVFMPLQG